MIRDNLDPSASRSPAAPRRATVLPPVFVSHGSPMIALEPGEAGRFMQQLGRTIDAEFGRPRAIVSVSAHTAARVPVVLGAAQHETIHDFGGFDPRLFQMRYDAAGEPALAADIAARLRAAGQPAELVPQGGLDHGAWTALRYLYPDVDVPVVPLGFVPGASPAAQFALGEALHPLTREGVWVLGSGSITHNLRRVFAGGGLHPLGDQPEIPQSRAFRAWMESRSTERDWTALFDYRRAAPHAVDMHPTDEHLLPWYVAAGAGGREHSPLRIHASVTMGSLGMDAYAFGAEAGRLQAALTAGRPEPVAA